MYCLVKCIVVVLCGMLPLLALESSVIRNSHFLIGSLCGVICLTFPNMRVLISYMLLISLLGISKRCEIRLFSKKKKSF